MPHPVGQPQNQPLFMVVIPADAPFSVPELAQWLHQKTKFWPKKSPKTKPWKAAEFLYQVTYFSLTRPKFLWHYILRLLCPLRKPTLFWAGIMSVLSHVLLAAGHQHAGVWQPTSETDVLILPSTSDPIQSHTQILRHPVWTLQLLKYSEQHGI